MNENKFCKNCGSPLKEGDAFCGNCGTAVNKTENVQVNEQTNYVNNIPQSNNVNTIPQPNYGNNVPQPNSNGKVKYLIIGLVVLILIGVGVYFLLTMGKDKKDDNKPVNNNNQINNNTNKSTNKVTYEGFTFAIPSGYTYENDGESLLISNSDNTCYSAIYAISGDFDQLLINKEAFVSGLESGGVRVDSFEQGTYSGLSAITMKVYSSGKNMLLGYIKGNSNTIFVVSAANLYKDYDYDFYSEIVGIIKTGV